MKYGEGKYGSFLYGIWRGAGVYIRTAAQHALAIKVDIFKALRVRARTMMPLEIEVEPKS